jgi:hypothetical protein
MTRSRRRLSAAAMRAALALLLAAALVGGLLVQTAFAQHYENHKPLRGNYPGSYADSAPSVPASGTFDWAAAGVGAAGMLGLVLARGAVRARGRTASRERAHDVPLVLHVRDDRPA